MLEVDNLTKTYQHRREPVHALKNVSLEIEPGDFVAVTGGSGSGKTTLVLTLGGLIRPTSGQVRYKGAGIYSQTGNQLAGYRNRTVGFVLQTFNLIPYLSVLENVMVPMLLRYNSSNGRANRARALLDKMELASRFDFFPRELSVGQQQRVAIARAMANDPEVILADEPTGNLDPTLSSEILQILRDLNEKEGRTVVMVTHDPSAAHKASRVMKLKDGELLPEET